jgi:hypothetical protein
MQIRAINQIYAIDILQTIGQYWGVIINSFIPIDLDGKSIRGVNDQPSVGTGPDCTDPRLFHILSVEMAR